MENNFIIIIRTQDSIIKDPKGYKNVLSRQYCCTIISSWEQAETCEIMFRLKATEHCIIEILKILSWKFPSAGVELFEFVAS